MNRAADSACALRAVVIDGCPNDLQASIGQCREAGIIVNGWAECGAAGLELIESLPSPPDLVIMELDLLRRQPPAPRCSRRAQRPAPSPV